jgi:hypothetical protein
VRRHITPQKAIIMIWYVGAVAVLNLGFGYLLARMLGAPPRQLVLATGDSSDGDEAGEY